MPKPVRILKSFPANEPEGTEEIDPHLSQEWLVTNGLGGYASGTVLGPVTRRYHGLLIAALASPAGRFMMLHGISERMRMPGGALFFGGPRELAATAGALPANLVEFRLELGLPVWIFDLEGSILEKRVL